MLDPITSELISMLEAGSKTIQELCTSSNLEASNIHDRFAPLVEECLIVRTGNDNDTVYSANSDKFDSMLSDSKHFDGAIDMVAKMDTFLN